jgi:hypothetical protein
VAKHRQLVRQVGAFGGFALETSTDLDNMLLSVGSTFIFGSWVFKVGDNGKLQGRLLEDSKHHDMIFLAGSTFIFRSWICEADSDGKLQGHLLKNLGATMVEQLTKEIS